MARPARPWFRFYVEATADPKLRRLNVAHRWLWVCVLAAARKSPDPGYLLLTEDEPMQESDLADFAAMPLNHVKRGMAELKRLGMVEDDYERSCWFVPRFKERQYESDSSTQRTSQWRSKNRHSDGGMTAVVTPPETETENYPPNPPPTGGISRANGNTPRQLAAKSEEQRKAQAAEERARDVVRQLQDLGYEGEGLRSELTFRIGDAFLAKRVIEAAS